MLLMDYSVIVALVTSVFIVGVLEVIRRLLYYGGLFSAPKGWPEANIQRVSVFRLLMSVRSGMPGPECFSYLFPSDDDPTVKSCYTGVAGPRTLITWNQKIISQMLLDIDTFEMDGSLFGGPGVPTFDLLGDCLLTHSVEEWKRYHVAPLPLMKAADTGIATMLALSNSYVQELPMDGCFDVVQTNFRLGILSYVNFFEGKEVNRWEQLDPALVSFAESVRTMTQIAADLILCMLPTRFKYIWMAFYRTESQKFYAAQNIAMEYTAKVLEETIDRNDPSSASIYAAVADNENSFTMEHIQRNLIAFNIANTSMGPALSTVLYHLALDPVLQDECRAEAIELLQKISISASDLEKLKVITAVIKEALRMYPPVIMSTPRRATKDCTIGQLNIPKDTIIIADYWRLHRDPDHFDDPTTFDHTRWLPNSVVEESSKSVTRMMEAFKPFAAGPRVCPGRPMAMRFMRVLLCSVLRDCEISLPDDSPHKEGLIFRSSFMLDPVDLYLRVKKRSD